MMRQLVTALMCVIGSTMASAQQPALRVVVIEGEDAVNIIQQKTAVRPVVEVRDRNNLPVPGVLVTFSIEGGKAATFGGASTFTVATNAAGQAAVSGLTPTVSGAFQIQVSAVFQGQVATATIAQTNVLTAAQAAAASAASGGGASGAGGGGGAGGAGGATGAGGGLSTTTLVVAGAAVAGGAVAVVELKDKIGGGVGEKYTGTFSGTISGTVSGVRTCTYTRTISAATARLGLREHTDSLVRGEFEYEGTSSITASTCPVPENPQLGGSIDELTGSPSSFSGRQVVTFPAITGPNADRITSGHVYSFQGSINGNSITGVFNYEETIESTIAPSGERHLGVGTFTITFQKQ